MYFDVNFNMFFKIMKLHLLVSELHIHQTARCNNKKKCVFVGPVNLIYCSKQDRQCALNTTLGHVRATIVGVENNNYEYTEREFIALDIQH